jgi:hypothetical protein
MFGRNKKKDQQGIFSNNDNDYITDRRSSRTLTNNEPVHQYGEPTKQQVKRATRTRLCWALLASFFLLVSVVFLILVEIGDTKVSRIRNRIYFIKLDLSDIIPVSVPNAQLINSIAQTLGLHDFYTVGLWGYCEGNAGSVTDCSTPRTLFWFNPVEILQSQLLAGATSKKSRESEVEIGADMRHSRPTS